MSFIAGVVHFNRLLKHQFSKKFLHALKAMEKQFSCPIKILKAKKYILAKSDFPHMWQGSKILKGSHFDAIATGIQWRKIIDYRNTLDYLVNVFRNEESEILNYFDYFSCAIVDKKNNEVILATDPLGLSPILYWFDSEVLLFSSHQSFLKKCLYPNIKFNLQGVLEYLIIGHNIGNKSLLENVNLLSPGFKLKIRQNESKTIQYNSFDNVEIEKDMSRKTATDMIYAQLLRKFTSYSDLTNKPFSAFLSGGWDSRLIAALLNRVRKLVMTYTTQQDTRVHYPIISEKKIAQEVAQYIGVANKFIDPLSLKGENAYERAKIMDFTTWFHGWSFAIAESIPYDKFILSDGLFGDFAFRGLRRIIGSNNSDALYDCVIDDKRKLAIKILHSQFLNGFNAYTPGIKKWKTVFDQKCIEDFAVMLKQEIQEEILNIRSENFIGLFCLKNRSRRGISTLPRWIFGRKGAVILPYCDYELIQMCLSIPVEIKFDLSLHKSLLEKSMPGLSYIPSTNTKDADKLESYLVDPSSSWRGKIISMANNAFPKVFQILRIMNKRIHTPVNNDYVKSIFKRPPRVFMNFLTPELKLAIKKKNKTYVKKYNFFLELIMLLDRFFSEY